MRKIIRPTNLALFFAVVLLACGYIVNGALFRDLWFDEALTFLNFVMLPSAGDIYRSYVIPNNQILFSILLKYWLVFQPPGMATDFFMRLLPLLFGVGSLWMIYLWKRFFSRRTVYLIMAALALSLPFEIYSVALRGYMPGLFLLLLCVNIALRFRRTPTPWYAIGYFAAALAALAVLPSNIVALGGIALRLMPLSRLSECRRFGWWFLAAAPLAGAALFYLPILDNVRMVLALKEGWRSNTAAAILFYAAYVLSFLPLIAVSAVHRPGWEKMVKIAGIVLLVLPFFLLRHPAPFPRVFFPYWAVLLLVLADGLNPFLAATRRTWSYPLLAALVVACGLGMQFSRGAWSDWLAKGRGMDDYFYPEYARAEFRPHDTVTMLQEAYGSALPPVYVSFQADFYPMIFYGLLNGVDARAWLFDGPRGRVEKLPRGALAVLSDRPEDLEEFSRRFGVTPVYVGSSGFQRIYRVAD
jgi:uncharacterized membrane protein